jgi:integrase
MEQPPQVIAFPEPKQPPKPRPFGYLVSRRGRLSVRFTYFGEVVQKATALADTPQNREKSRAFLDEIGKAIQAGTFRFAEAFPGASEEEKEKFAQFEGRAYRASPETVQFADYVTQWVTTHLDTDASENRRKDYGSIIEGHLLPYFGSLCFAEITGVHVVDFVRNLAGLSASRIRNILIPLRIIWEDAEEEHGWDLRNPFEHLRRRNRRGQLIPQRTKSEPQTFRLHEWQTLMEHMAPHYQPICELMVMTGMISSELGRLTSGDLRGDVLVVAGTKTAYRRRELPISPALRLCLDQLVEQRHGDSLVTWEDGRPWAETKSVNVRFRNGPWSRAFHAAGLAYRKPYAMRHTFAAWNLMRGVHPDKVVRLMGHGSRQMIYEVYGRYVEGLEDDVDAIQAYLEGQTNECPHSGSGDIWGDIRPEKGANEL